MAKVSTNISLDPELKEKAIKLFSNFGLDLSTAITLFLSQSVREEKIPFEIIESNIGFESIIIPLFQ